MSVVSDVEKWLEPVKGWFDPGGDPAEIREAATAWRALAASLRDVVSKLSPVAAGLENSWKSLHDPADESASIAFQRAWTDFKAAMLDYAASVDTQAARLDAIADEIQTAQLETRRLFEMAVMAIGAIAALSAFSFLVPDVVLEADEDAVAASRVVYGLRSVLNGELTLWQGLRMALIRVGSRFVLGGTTGLAAEMLRKVAFNHQNPLDPSSYTAGDLDNLILSGFMNALFGEMIRKWPMVNRLANSKNAWPKAATTATLAATGNSVGSSISQLYIQGKPFDRSSLGSIAENTGFQALSGGLIGGLSVAFSSSDAAAVPGMNAEVPGAVVEPVPGGLADAGAGLNAGVPGAVVEPAVPGVARAVNVEVRGVSAGPGPEVNDESAGAVVAPVVPAGAGDTGVPAGEEVPASSTVVSANRIVSLLNKTGITRNDLLRSTPGLPAGVMSNLINFRRPPALILPGFPPVPSSGNIDLSGGLGGAGSPSEVE